LIVFNEAHNPEVAGFKNGSVERDHKSKYGDYYMRAAERGEERVPVSVAVGIDPVSFMMSGTRLADLGVDEFSLPWDVAHFARLKNVMRNLVKLYTPVETPSMVIVSIDKKLPGRD